MHLRPHHLLCIQKFTGHGYNENFTAHMAAVVSTLRKNPESLITLTRGCDDLCRKCPNNINGICTSLEKVALMDGSVLSVCNFSYGEKLTWEKAAKEARERIFETEEFSGVCAGCEWFELCKNTEDIQ